MVIICRLCLGIIPSSPIISPYEDYVAPEDKINYVLPEIDTSLTPTCHLCNLCTHLLSATYSFKRGCLKTEETIKEYICQHNNAPINLHEVKKFRTTSSIIDERSIDDSIKIEVHDVEIKLEIVATDQEEQPNITFTCDKCQKSFKDEEMVENHRKECLLIKCNRCKKTLFSKSECDKHRKCHPTHKRQRCMICNKTFEQLSELKAHNLQSHNNKTFSCDTCEFSSSSKMELDEHNLSHEILPKNYRCNICKNTYYQLDHLQAHKTTHKPDEENRCTVCDTIFNNSYLLRRHVKSRHREPIVCEICGVKFNSKWILENHTRRHTGERPYKCDTCGRSFTQKVALLAHVRSKHDTARPYKCNVCGKGFAVGGAFRRHVKAHSTPKEKSFQCLYDGCNKRYKREAEHAKHLQRHIGKKSHKCGSCEKTFWDKSTLKRHTSCHTGEAPFECHLCQIRFSRRYKLEMHLKLHEEGIKIEDSQPSPS